MCMTKFNMNNYSPQTIEFEKTILCIHEYLTIGSCFSVHYPVMEDAGSLESTKEAQELPEAIAEGNS